MRMLAAVVFLVPALASADATRSLASAGGKCTVTLPGEWTVTGAIAQSKDKKVSIAVAQPKSKASFADLKASLKQEVKDAKVVKDTDRELELEGKAVDGKPNVYRAIVVAGAFCSAEARYDGAADVARNVVHTLAPGR